MRVVRAAIPLFLFWLALTGSLRPTNLAIGAVLAGLLGMWSSAFLWREEAPVLTLTQTGRFVLYVGHLVRSIVQAAIQVAEVVLDPRMPIRPVLVGHRAVFTRDVSRVTFANSITLTPGTLTVDVDGDTFYIHCLAERFATDIANGDLERRVSRVFEE
jgi:multicomponent Na+:H+ antiporter subunit E